MFKFSRFVFFIIMFSIVSCEKLKPIDSTPEIAQEFSRLDNEFLINGTTFNAENKTIYLYKLEDLLFSVIDSATVSNNKFTFKGIAEKPAMYAISRGKNTAKFNFLVDSSLIDVFFSKRPANSSSYSPTQVQKDYVFYTTKALSFKDKGMRLYYDMRGDFSDKNIKDLKQKRNTLFSEENAFVTKFIKEHPNSYYSAIVIKNRLRAYNYKANRPLYNKLSSELKSLSIGKHIDSFLTAKEKEKKTITIEKQTIQKEKPVTTIPISEEDYRPKAYTISGNNQYGEAMSLHSIPRGKVILVDFWASWCMPCRATNPTLVQLYNKYNDQGFEILSVSEDKNEAEWMNAIAIDGLTWDYHVIDKNKSIAFRYGVESIPFKLLIDKNGNIASEKISGHALESKIQELLNE